MCQFGTPLAKPTSERNLDLAGDKILQPFLEEVEYEAEAEYVAHTVGNCGYYPSGGRMRIIG